MDMKIRQSNFKIPNVQVLAQNLFLLNKMVGQLSLEFQNIRIKKQTDENGIFFTASFNLDAVGKDAQLNQSIDEEFPFIFYFKKFKNYFLIFKGENLLQEE